MVKYSADTDAIDRDALAGDNAYAEIRRRFREELTRRIVDLELENNVRELQEAGYTIIKDAAPIDFFNDIRSQILELLAARSRKECAVGNKLAASETMRGMIEHGRTFEVALLNSKINALAAFMLGDGYILNAYEAVVNSQFCSPLFLHSDNAYIPDPFPALTQTATFLWATEDLNVETGATRIVPGSHRLARHPTFGEGNDSCVPIECAAGSIAVWDGATWHGNYGRRAEGQRVTLHMSFCRMHIRSFLNNSRVPQEIIDRNGPLFAQLLGRSLPYGNDGKGEYDAEVRANATRLFMRRM